MEIRAQSCHPIDSASLQLIQAFFSDDPIEDIQPLKGGWNNPVFKITCSSGKQVLFRRFEKEGLASQQQQLEIQKYLSKLHLSPKVLYELPESLGFIQAFVIGEHHTKLTVQQIQYLGRQLAQFHQFPFNVSKVNLQTLYAEVRSDDQRLHAKLSKSLDVLLDMKPRYVVSHGDLVPQNILWQQKQCFFIDFEYVHLQDIGWDLAQISVEFQFTQTQTQKLICSYESVSPITDISSYHIERRVELLKPVYAWLCQKWWLQSSRPEPNAAKRYTHILDAYRD